ALRCRLSALLILALLPIVGMAADPPEPFATIEAAVKANRLLQTKSSDSSKGTFCETLKNPGALVGFELGLGKFVNVELIYAVRPIYLNAEGEQIGAGHGLFTNGTKDGKPIRSDVTRTVRVKAKAGYAVGGVIVRQGLFMNGLALRCYRIDGARLDLRD